MANKTYDQYCAIACALDVIGERWTLLIVRNLLAGHRRFSDLMKGLPGISTNMLTNRLKTLEAAGVVTTRYLPPPAASTVYELTEAGYALTPALGALAQWGARLPEQPHRGQKIVPESMIFMIHGMFWQGQHPDIELRFNIQIQDGDYDHTFGVAFADEQIDVQPIAFEVADFTLQFDLETLLLVSSQQAELPEKIEDGAVKVEGNQDKIAQLLSVTR